MSSQDDIWMASTSMRTHMRTILLAATVLALCTAAGAVAPPTDLRVADVPDDEGGKVRLTWRLSPADTGMQVRGYLVSRAASPEGPFQDVNLTVRGTASYEDQKLANLTDYHYRVRTLGAAGDTSEPIAAGPVQAREQWFKRGKVNILLTTALFIAMVTFFLNKAKTGTMFLRRLAGLDAVEEAVGRATEMGKPILFVLGTSSISDIATIAGLNILGQVARKTAEYGTPLIVPTYDYIVHAVAREVVKEGYAAQGRPDQFSEDMVFFVTDNQMGYAAAISGIMSRQRPATNLFMGMFYAESMIMAEAGAATGAIQIAGTDAVTQLP
ncbi:fibronectin type III domain-containing protein, partial [bacterium]|nr:fibronectin type III domain-containing protein [bacterium]